MLCTFDHFLLGELISQKVINLTCLEGGCLALFVRAETMQYGIEMGHTQRDGISLSCLQGLCIALFVEAETMQ